MASKTMTTQKKKDLKDQYQVTDLKEYHVMRTRTTAYPSRRVIMGEQWSGLNPLHLPLYKRSPLQK